MEKQLLIVCTGNTCRSPFAAAAARSWLNQLGVNGWAVASAGLAVMAPSPASDNMLTVASEFGEDLSDHRSRPLTMEMLNCAELVLVMTAHQKSILLHQRPEIAERVFTLAEFVGRFADVSDPFGGNLDIYHQTASDLLELTRLAAEKIQKKEDRRRNLRQV